MVMPRTTERRRHPRYNVAAMYSCVVARRAMDMDDAANEAAGHVYNISEGGARIEIEGTFHVGEIVHLDITLPGTFEQIRACGKIAWIIGRDDDPAARRMAVRFERFDTRADRWRMLRFIEGAAVRRLAA